MEGGPAGDRHGSSRSSIFHVYISADHRIACGNAPLSSCVIRDDWAHHLPGLMICPDCRKYVYRLRQSAAGQTGERYLRNMASIHRMR